MRDEPLTADDFSTFFQDVHKCAPFPWQNRLAKKVLEEGEWPTTIDLPTGTGKTAVLDIAVFTLAASPTLFPRRIVFVIDRRIVVDQVCRRARDIADCLRAPQTPLLCRVRDRLLELSDGGEALGIAALRGGIPIDNKWARQPDQPWVVVSTVDQFGSRLLFRGYGVTRRMRPVHAGLAGNDCLVILDEVHLSVPFAETLKQIHTFEPETLPRRFAVVEMSATPSTKDRPFQLEPIDDIEVCEELRRRVCARKEARLVRVQNHKVMPRKIVDEVRKMTSPKVAHRPTTIGVVVNRVRVARETYEALGEAGYDVHLLTGRMRALDRAKTLETIAPVVDPDGDTTRDAATIVVATQAIEVGADFSFDVLITECAAIDSLRQRFGRLDRRGKYYARTGTPAQAVVVGPKSVVASKKPDPIYGDAVRHTWDELTRREQDNCIDVGLQALADFPEEARAPRDKAPVVMRTHMDAWVQTSPEPIVQPLIEQFLHGMERTDSADVSIVWRRDCTPGVLELVPPRASEFLQVPVGAARAWLAGHPEVEVSDHGVAGDNVDATDSESNGAVYRWIAVGKPPEPVQPQDIRPGDIIVVPWNRGGVLAGTWDPAAGATVDDLGDQAQLGGHAKLARAVLRLDIDMGVGAPPRPSDEVEAVEPLRDRVENWLATLRTSQETQPAWLLRTAGLLLDRGFEITPVGTTGVPEDGYFVLTQRRVADDLMDGYDESSSQQGTGSTLSSHLDGVARRAASFVWHLGLSQELAEDLHLAGRLHDLGKIDRRFQEQLVGGDPVALETLDQPLAKSRPGVKWVSRYPRGMRHEFVSLAMAESNPNVLSGAHDADLVLHLIGSHHGCGRPLPPIIDDPDPQDVESTVDGHHVRATTDLGDTRLALDVADRFWRLVERYGYYGLAWLEAVMRLADHRESAEPS